MAESPRAAAIRGKPMQWTWTAGPTRGQVQEHILDADGNRSELIG